MQPPVANLPPAAPLDPQKNRLDAVLLAWEQKMQGVQSLAAAVKRTDIDPVTKNTEEYRGQLKFMRPNRADLYVARTTNPQQYDRFLCTGNYIFQFMPQQKLIRAHPLPQRAAGQPALENSFVGFLAGMTAVEAKRRFDMALLKEDQHYVYLEVKPRLPEDKAEFSIARLALLQSTMMPREIQFVPPNGAVLKWDIESMDINARVTPADFATPQTPQGWQMQTMPPPGAPQAPPAAQPPPRVARPNGK
jgi:TIGR03009 family protein